MKSTMVSLIALAAGSLFATPAFATENPAGPVATPAQAKPDDDAQAKDSEVIVTGTRRTDRTVLESPVPVDVFTPSDFKAQPSPQLQTILKTLVPSFNQQRNLLGDASAFVRPPTLRGLAADQILVLLNGKRVHRTALVGVAAGGLNAGSQGADLSQISAPAVGRIEVLRDGAAAQYGSDAIAGVINIGLRKDSEGLEFTARYGQSYRGDGGDTQLTAFWATKLGNDGGFFNITGEFIDQQVWDRSVERPEIAPLRAAGITPPYPTGNRLGGPENRAYRAVYNAEIPLGDTNFYLFGNYGWQKQGNDFNYRRPITVTTTQPIDGRPGTATLGRSVNPVFLDRIGFLPNGTPLWDSNGRQYNVNTQLPGFSNGFIPFFMAANEDFSLVAGLKGTKWGVNYDISGAIGTNQIRYTMTNTINASLGPTTPTSFYMGKLVQREVNFNADFNTEGDIGLAKPVFIAWGFEFRREAYEVGLGDRPSYEVGPYASQFLAEYRLNGVVVPAGTPGAVVVQRFNANGTPVVATSLPGSNGFQGFGPDSVVEGGRNSVSVYLDVDTQITKNLDIGVAARYDYFNDFGSTFNGKISARWEINDIIALRGATSTGFRAPTPGQQFTQNLTTGFPFGSVVPLGIQTVRPDSVLGRYYLAQPLTPEKSFSFSAGAVLTPGGGFTATIDFYQISVRDRIGITGNIDPSADRADLIARGVPGAGELGAIRYFTNAFDTRTTGVDLVLTHRASTGIGSFNTSLAVNYNETVVTNRRTITGAVGSGRVITLSPVDNVRKGTIEQSVPKWRAVLSENFTSGIFDATARLNYFGEYTTFFDPITSGFGVTPNVPTVAAAQALYPNPWPKTFGAQVSVDLEVGVTFQKRFRLAVGAENLFGTFPERETRNVFPGTGGQANGSVYSDFAPIGQLGGFWYVRGSAKF